MTHGDSWFTAQEPRFVGAAAQPPQRVAPHVKRQQAQDLADAVAAHRHAGGAYVVLDGTPATPAPRRQPGE